MSSNDSVARDLLQAVEFAAQMHRDQRRKGVDASPYINHPIQVAEMIVRVGGVDDTATLVAAILHDTVEDTEASAEDIEDIFGPEVRDLVMEVTDDKSLPKAERKRLQKIHAPHMSERAKLIKIADKTCNVRDIGQSPPADWDVERLEQYLVWAKSVVDACRGTNAKLERYFDECLATSAESLGAPMPE